jgi:plasmid stabilization system protein ParE
MMVELSPRARREANRYDDWWRANRAAAPGLFEHELARAIAQIATAPQSGIAVRGKGGQDYRRLTLSVTRYYVYWRLLGPQHVQVVAVWSAVRGRGPAL